MFYIQHPLVVYTPTRVIQGGSDSGNHFQAVTQEKFIDRVANILQWMDDFLIHAKTESEFLDQLEAFIRVCNDKGFKLDAEKTDLCLRQARFCGRLITSNGFKHDPRELEAILNMSILSTDAELQQLLCATN